MLEQSSILTTAAALSAISKEISGVSSPFSLTVPFDSRVSPELVLERNDDGAGYDFHGSHSSHSSHHSHSSHCSGR
jgi:hypothetical protein